MLPEDRNSMNRKVIDVAIVLRRSERGLDVSVLPASILWYFDRSERTVARSRRTPEASPADESVPLVISYRQGQIDVKLTVTPMGERFRVELSLINSHSRKGVRGVTVACQHRAGRDVITTLADGVACFPPISPGNMTLTFQEQKIQLSLTVDESSTGS